jgi:hypothetical protein
VPRVQMIRGIPFSYQPPPRTIVPHAAGLKGQGGRCALPLDLQAYSLFELHFRVCVPSTADDQFDS